MKDKIKQHIKDHKVAYSVGTAVVFAGITYLLMRSYSDSSIQGDVIALAKRGPAVPGKTSVNALEVNRGGLVLGNNYALNNVSFISSARQGPPSWVVRCKETGNLFTSQQKAAVEMGLSPSELSKHLNTALENVNGYHFERICLAA